MIKNKGGLTQEQIAIIIIVVLVGIIILGGLFGARIQNWIYNLPGYSVPKEDTEIDISGQNDINIGGTGGSLSTLGTKADPYIGFENNKEKIKDRINKKESFYLRTLETNPEDFYFHYSPDMTQPVIIRENVWMYDQLTASGFSDTNIKIFYPVNEMESLPKNNEARDIIDLILSQLNETIIRMNNYLLVSVF